MTTALVTTSKTFSLSPQNFEQALTFSQYLADSDMVPKDFKGKPGNCLIAMQWGAEIGLQPLQAMQNIAVINGRPALWGDALIALARASSACEYIVESQTETVATCKVKRRGEPETVRTFSMDDAKKAGLIGKQGPWSQYPKRMMQMRARGFALRDVFPDVLKGMAMVEEAQDTPRDMGTAQEVTQAPAPVAPGVLESAQTEAEQGVSAYSAFWKAASADTRKAIGKDEHNRLKDIAIAADKARTVESAPEPTPAPKQQEPAQRVPKTFEQVMAGLVAAQNIDALYVAGEFIGDIADMEESNILAGKFDELKAELEGS
jgi:hypothetical protein